MAKAAAQRQSKHERLHVILGRFGDDLITREQFEALMRDQKLAHDDIDAYGRGELK
jgi:hypothetical protein